MKILALVTMLFAGMCLGFGLSRAMQDSGHASPVDADPHHNYELAYLDGVQVGQQMIMETLMPTVEQKTEARQRAAALIRDFCYQHKMGCDSNWAQEYLVAAEKEK